MYVYIYTYTHIYTRIYVYINAFKFMYTYISHIPVLIGTEGAQPSLALIIVLSLFLPLTPIGPDDDVYLRLQHEK
jgi:hypothetical protein